MTPLPLPRWVQTLVCCPRREAAEPVVCLFAGCGRHSRLLARLGSAAKTSNLAAAKTKPRVQAGYWGRDHEASQRETSPPLWRQLPGAARARLLSRDQWQFQLRWRNC